MSTDNVQFHGEVKKKRVNHLPLISRTIIELKCLLENVALLK